MLLTVVFQVILVVKIGIQSYNVSPKAHRVFAMKGFQTRKSLFGYSVAAIMQNGKCSVFVGAPLADSINGIEFGALYRCGVENSKSCEEVPIGLNDLKPSFANKTGSWTGATMNTNTKDSVIVCAPRWRNIVNSEYRMNGGCHLISLKQKNTQITHLLPLSDSEMQRTMKENVSLNYYQYGQTGFSLLYTDHEQSLTLGGPGIYNWQGSLTKIKLAENIQNVFEGYTQFPGVTKQITDFNLFGYSIAAGKFRTSGEIYYVVTAPGDKLSFGSVFVFPLPSYRRRKIIFFAIRNGTQIGEYFGASVSAPDVNGDGLNDIFVGAPLHSREGIRDVGCIYAFQTTVDGIPEDGQILHGDLVRNSRFGAAISPPMDIDVDGYQDIMVGAPYEHDNSGAIYVFYGSGSGINNKYSQKLTPELLSNQISLKGLGMSFSKPIEVDQNKYPHIVVGSPFSDNAVLLIANPVIDFKTTFAVNPTRLNLDSTSAEVESCLQHLGRNFESSIDIELTITMPGEEEKAKGRIIFQGSGAISVTKIIKVPRHYWKCEIFHLNLRREKNDARMPIWIEMTYKLPDQFAHKFALNPLQNGNTKNISISFDNGCDLDGNPECTTDLRVEARFLNLANGKIVAGQEKTVELLVLIRNKDETAFLPKVEISLPSPLTVDTLPQNCMESNELLSTISCSVTSPFFKDASDYFIISIDTTLLTDKDLDMPIHLRAFTERDEGQIQKTAMTIVSLAVWKEASIIIDSWPIQEVKSYNEKSRNTNIEILTFNHEYRISNEGATRLNEIELTLTFHSYPRNAEFIDLGSHTFTLNGVVNPCIKRTTSERPSTLEFFGSAVPGDVKVEEENSEDLRCSKVFLDCQQIICKVSSFSNLDSAALTANIGVNIAKLEHYYDSQLNFKIRSKLYVNITSLTDHVQFSGSWNATNIATTILTASIGDRKSKRLRILDPLGHWNYALGAVAGLICNMLIIFVLSKMGFFHRQTAAERWEKNKPKQPDSDSDYHIYESLDPWFTTG